MSYQPIRRAPDAFQQPVAEEELPAICRRVFGARTELRSAVELAGGYYNNTFQLDIGAAQPVILRVAPEPARHTRADPQLMRNEHAALPFLAPIAALLPQTLAADFTHDLIGRDYLIQTRLYGVPADQRLGDFATAEQGAFFQQLGEITKVIDTNSRIFYVDYPVHSNIGDQLINLLSDDHSNAEEGGRHCIVLEPYGYRWFRVGGLDYLLRRSEV